MSESIERERTAVFIGDSVTDCGRARPGIPVPGNELGDGYVGMIADRLAIIQPAITVVNTGVSGNRAVDLASRWQKDCLDWHPEILTILIGVNDMWRRYDEGDPTSSEDFEASYRDLLTRAQDGMNPRIVLLEPILVPFSDEQASWREDLDSKIAIVRRLSDEFGTTLVRSDVIMNSAAARLGASAVVLDGIHPTPQGHRILADAWFAAV